MIKFVEIHTESAWYKDQNALLAYERSPVDVSFGHSEWEIAKWMVFLVELSNYWQKGAKIQIFTPMSTLWTIQNKPFIEENHPC